MNTKHLLPGLAAFSILVVACNKSSQIRSFSDLFSSSTAADTLPPPYATPSTTKNSVVIGWPANKTPAAPAGFTVARFATGLQNPRWMYQGPNGDIFVAESTTSGASANRITLLRDANKDGKVDFHSVFLQNLNKPLGMLILNGKFYVANTDGVWQYGYSTGMTAITATGKQILSLPAGGYNNHWTRNLLANAAGTKIYVTVGSGTNAAEQGMQNEVRRADILEINPDGSGEKIYASGLRNPVGADWAPGSSTLWTSVNERDLLGDELVPDYLTSVKPGGFYGWPYAYFGQHEDPRLKGQRPDLVAQTIVPDVDLGSHTASLGLAFYTKTAFPATYHNGAFIGQHGSWNRSSFAGYKVMFVPFSNGTPSGRPQAFLTGFIANETSNQVYGRPAGVCAISDGSLLVADDAGNTVWRVSYSGAAPGNQPPIANAGDDVSIALSWHFSPLLNATLSKDPDGWIKTVSWTLVSGPGGYTIANPGALETRVSFTATGNYVFRVTLTDNLGAVSFDDKQITVSN